MRQIVGGDRDVSKYRGTKVEFATGEQQNRQRPQQASGCTSVAFPVLALLSMSPASAHPKHFLSDKVEHFTESVIREMTRQAMQHNAVNLAQGFPDFPAPAEIKRAAQEAIAADINQYGITWGAKSLRAAIARQMREWQGIEVDPEREIVVCCGSTEAMIATLLAVCNKGDEVVVFEPFYENYGPDSILSGAKPRFVSLRPPQRAGGEWTFDEQELREAFKHQTGQQQTHQSKTKAIILNTPNNPTGKVFSRKELELIRDLCVEYNVLAITDEIYEHILYDGSEHISIARLDGMRERTVTINGLSKSYSVTGWRVGWAVAPAGIINAIRKVHDFLTVGAPAPLQEAGAVALSLPCQLLPRTGRAVSDAARSSHPGPGESRLCLLPSAGRVLRNDRHQRLWVCERRGVRELPGEGHRHRLRAWIQFLQASEGRIPTGTFRLLQET